jgi:hypothetical protein
MKYEYAIVKCVAPRFSRKATVPCYVAVAVTISRWCRQAGRAFRLDNTFGA